MIENKEKNMEFAKGGVVDTRLEYRLEELNVEDNNTVVITAPIGFEFQKSTLDALQEFCSANRVGMIVIPEGMSVNVSTAKELIEQLQVVVDRGDEYETVK